MKTKGEKMAYRYRVEVDGIQTNTCYKAKAVATRDAMKVVQGEPIKGDSQVVVLTVDPEQGFKVIRRVNIQ